MPLRVTFGTFGGAIERNRTAIAAALLAATVIAIAAPAHAATERPGDRIDGVAVIDRLDTADLAPARVHRFWFRAGTNAIGQGWYVPVIVVRGARPGPRLLLTAGIHGDELNGIDVIHRLTAKLDPAALAGTLVAVPGLNTPGLLASSREFPGDASNLNRSMPGDPDGGAASTYAHRLWTRLLRPNADAAVNLHTQSRGTAYAMFAFASTPRTRRMAELVGPDIVKMDPGDKGTVENELTRAGVPAITYELARPEVFDGPTVDRAVAGIENLMTEMRMLGGTVRAAQPAPFVANRIEAVRTPVAGWMTLLVTLGGVVAKGQAVATVADPFGRIVAAIAAPVAGRVNTIATDPRREAGGMVARIVWWDPDPKCANGC